MMIYDNEEYMIKTAIENVHTPDYDIYAMIKGSIGKKTFHVKRFLTVALALLLCSALSVYAAASNMPSFNKLLSYISPEIAWAIRPIEMSAEDQGIRVEVVAAGRYDNRVKLYVTIQDMISDRIGEHIQLDGHYVSDSLAGSNGAGSVMIDLVNYDKERHINTLLLEVNRQDIFRGEKLTFSIDAIRYDSMYYERYDTGLDLTEIPTDVKYLNVMYGDLDGWSGSGTGEDGPKDSDTLKLLKPDVINRGFEEVSSSKLSSVGIVDGKLHVQTWRDRGHLGSYNDFYLIDPQGNALSSSESYFFALDDRGDFLKSSGLSQYTEQVFNVSSDELSKYRLVADFSEDKYVMGDWSVTFNADDGEKSLKADCDIEVNGITLKDVTVNPFGVRFSAEGEASHNMNEIVFGNKLSVILETEDGNIEMPVTGATNDWGDEIIYVNCDVKTPVDTESVKSITVNGETLRFGE